jgi:adenine-specific DNA-methyltransferase
VSSVRPAGLKSGASLTLGRVSAIDTPTLRKARGAFFTPEALTDFIASWALRAPENRVLEPSCGEAAFLLSAGRRLRELGAEHDVAKRLHGIEMHAPSAAVARDHLHTQGYEAEVWVGDFFDFSPGDRYDAVIGNPPYVRYQAFTGSDRAKAQRAALQAGVPLTGLASSWAAFTVQSARMVVADGRLGLVLPAELLSVNYAAPLRRYLMQRFARVHLAMFEQRVFPGATEEIVLLLAEGEGPTDHIVVSQSSNLNGLSKLDALRWSPKEPAGKWTPALLSAEPLAAYAALSEHFVDLLAWGETDLGMVTGNNRFFTMSSDEALRAEIPPDELRAISPAGSKHLRQLSFTKQAWRELDGAGRGVWLFRPDESPSPAARALIADGEARDVHRGYKCRVRDPWWQVPWIVPPDLLLTYMNHDTPRLVVNSAKVSYLNSVHGVRLNTTTRTLGLSLLPLACLNSVTLLGAELVGRSYGGGILKVEPKEADVLPVPAPETIEDARSDLVEVRDNVALLLARGQLMQAVRIVDQVLLVDHLSVGPEQLTLLRAAHGHMSLRRTSRGKAAASVES